MTSTRDLLRVHIRWMIRRDMGEVVGVEKDCFDYQWTEDDFLKVLRQRNCIGMVAEHHDKVIGYMVYELRKTELQLLNFAVWLKYWRRGVGTQMVDKLKAKLFAHRRTQLSLCVRESNLQAQQFFRRQGFRAVGVEHGYYEDSGEDAYRMVLRLPGES